MEVGGNFNLDLDISYRYDEENKLQTVTQGTTTTSMKYYADGMRAKNRDIPTIYIICQVR